MKALFILSLICSSYCLSAQQAYEITQEAGSNGVKILTGVIDKHLLKNDTAFRWYASSQQSYTPDTTIINSLAKVKEAKLQIIIFGGTWCEDTQFIIPKFFKLQELSGVPDEQVTFFGVNRKKLSVSHIAEAMGIINVPTIIVLKSGKELGRVVEYGKTGKWDKELADIINGH